MDDKEKPRDPEQVVEHANEQILIEGGEFIPRTKTPRKRVDPPFRANKRVAAAQRRKVKAPKSASNPPPKQSAKKSAKKAPKKAVKNTGKKTAKNSSKKVVKKKKAKRG